MIAEGLRFRFRWLYINYIILLQVIIGRFKQSGEFKNSMYKFPSVFFPFNKTFSLFPSDGQARRIPICITMVMRSLAIE
jgi:hypothetical protein